MRRSCLLLLVAARAAFAQPTPPAELTKEFQAGVDAFRLGNYDEARVHLEKARTLDPKLPGPHRFLAAVDKAQGKWASCIENARTALELNPASVETADTRKLHDDCRVSAGKAPYRGAELVDSAAVAVTSNVPGAAVKINGLTYGGTPMAPRPITAGKLEVDVEKRGWKPAHVEIDAPVGIVTDVDVELEADASQQNVVDVGKPTDKPTTGQLVLPTVGWLRSGAAAPASVLVDGKLPAEAKPALPDKVEPLVIVELAPGTHTVEIDADHQDPWRRRVRIVAGQKTVVTPVFVETEQRESKEHLGLYILAGGGAVLAVGFGFALAAEHAENDAREIQRVEVARDPMQPLSVTGAAEPVHTRADFQAKVDAASRDAIISDVAYGVGLAAVGVGIYYIYKGAKDRTDVPPPFAVAPTRGGAFIAKEIAW